MSKSKTISKKVAVAKTSSDANLIPESRNASTRATALPLGFASIFGLLAFGSLCGLVLIAPYLFSGFWPSSYEYWPQGVFLALTAITCVLIALEPNIKLPNSTTPKLLFAFFALCALSIFGTVYLHDSVLELARLAGVLAWFFIARALLGSEEYFARRATWLLIFIACGAVLVCVPAIVDFLKTRNPRQFGTFYNPNLFANYCALALPLSAAGVLALWRGDGSLLSNFKRGASVAAFFIIALGLFFTSSKGGFLAALCALLVFAAAVFYAKGEGAKAAVRAHKKVVAITTLLGIVIGTALFSKTIAPRLSSKMSEDNSTMFRVYTWRGTLKMASARPLLGFGLGSFPSAYTQFAETGYTRTSHELWLQIAAECGFPAMIFLLLACGASTLAGVRALKTENWKFAAGSLGAVTAFFIHGLTDAGWSISSIAVLAIIVLAILETGNRKRETESSIVTRQSSLNWLWLFAALPIALGSWLYQRAQSGEDLRSESRELMSKGAPASALEKATDAAQSDPFSSRVAYNLVQNGGGNAMHVIELQPTRALNYLYAAEGDTDQKDKAQLYLKAVELDPNDTEVRLSRANWKLEHNDQSGWKDLEYIVALKNKPYGKFPATPEMVDLNFAEAYAKLALRDWENKNPTQAKGWIEKGRDAIAEARKYEPQRRAMEQATQGASDERRANELADLEMQFRNLQKLLPQDPDVVNKRTGDP